MQEQKGNTCLPSITIRIPNARPQACSKYTQTSWTFALPPAPTQGLVLAPPKRPRLQSAGARMLWHVAGDPLPPAIFSNRN